MQPTAASLDVLLTGPASRVAVPGWMRRFSPRTVTGRQVKSLHGLPSLTVVEAKRPKAILERHDFLASLARQHTESPGAKILFVFDTETPRVDVEQLPEVLRHFSRFVDVEFARGPRQAELALMGAWAKLMVHLSRKVGKPASVGEDPLGELRGVIDATKPLRAASGRLSARAVARAFDLSVAELARLLGRTRQAVSKTDDAESLQPGLAPFARVARLQAAVSEEDFRAWLHLPNRHLGDRQPMDLIGEGRVEVVADLVDDMLTGSPG